MLNLQTLEETINEYYDEEMSISDLLEYEARIAISEHIRNYTNDNCFNYFKISNSIKLVKNRNKDKAERISRDFFKVANIRKKLFNFNSVFFKRF